MNLMKSYQEWQVGVAGEDAEKSQVAFDLFSLVVGIFLLVGK